MSWVAGRHFGESRLNLRSWTRTQAREKHNARLQEQFMHLCNSMRSETGDFWTYFIVGRKSEEADKSCDEDSSLASIIVDNERPESAQVRIIMWA
jgi:hypothetical protein